MSPASMASMSSSIRLARARRASVLEGRSVRRVDPELATKRRNRPELESANSPFLLSHRLGGFAGGQAAEEPQGDRFSLVVGQPRERGADGVELLSDDRDLVGAGVAVGPPDDRLQLGVLVTRPNMIDDRIPGQPEEPAPEGNATRLVPRQRFQGLDEDVLRQVL